MLYDEFYVSVGQNKDLVFHPAPVKAFVDVRNYMNFQENTFCIRFFISSTVLSDLLNVKLSARSLSRLLMGKEKDVVLLTQKVSGNNIYRLNCGNKSFYGHTRGGGSLSLHMMH